MDSTHHDEELTYAMKYTIENMNPSVTVEKLTELCSSSTITSTTCELFRFDRYTHVENTTTLLYTIINTEDYVYWLKRYLSDYFTLLPYDYDYKVLNQEADIVRDDIVVYARFSLPTHYHNKDPCWDEERDCIPCRICGGRMEPGAYSGLGCSRSCAYGR